MLCRTFFAVFFFAICSCTEKTAVSTQNIPGIYHTYRSEIIERYENGWNCTMEHERLLTLNADSTYTDENNSFMCFDWPDYTGTWSISENCVVLSYSDEYSGRDTTEMLQVDVDGNLRVIEDGFLEGAVLERKRPGWKRNESKMRTGGDVNL